jgi:Protein of unknown function (DUF1579)
MIQIYRSIFLAGLFTLMFMVPAIAQDEKSMDMAEAMRLAQPGPEHAILQTYVGEYDMTIKMNMEMKPGGAMVESKGPSTVKSLVGKRFIMFESLMEMMGMKGEAIQIMGFDRRFNTYFLFGIDYMGTYYVISKGVFNAATSQIELDGSDKWPTADGTMMDMPFKMHFSLPGNTGYTFKVLFPDKDGTFYTAVEGQATKK